MARGSGRDLGREAAWRGRLRRQAESGASVRAWCRRHRVTEAAFYWWRKELARRDEERGPSARRGAKAPGASFVPVRVSGDTIRVVDDAVRLADDAARLAEAPGQDGHQSGGGAPIEIVLTDGRRVRLTGMVSRAMLADVLDVLEARPC